MLEKCLKHSAFPYQWPIYLIFSWRNWSSGHFIWFSLMIDTMEGSRTEVESSTTCRAATFVCQSEDVDLAVTLKENPHTNDGNSANGRLSESGRSWADRLGLAVAASGCRHRGGSTRVDELEIRSSRLLCASLLCPSRRPAPICMNTTLTALSENVRFYPPAWITQWNQSTFRHLETLQVNVAGIRRNVTTFQSCQID